MVRPGARPAAVGSVASDRRRIRRRPSRIEDAV